MTTERLEALRRRLAEIEPHQGEAPVIPAAERADILRRRANQLAAARTAGDERQTIEIIAFRLGEETYAFDSRHIREVCPLKELTPIPCTPPFILGIINLRGELCPVIALKRLFGLAEPGLANATRAIIIHDSQIKIGLIADAIAGVRQIDPHDIAPAPQGVFGLESGFLHGITADGTAILDAGSILHFSGLIVNEQVDRH